MFEKRVSPRSCPPNLILSYCHYLLKNSMVGLFSSFDQTHGSTWLGKLRQSWRTDVACCSLITGHHEVGTVGGCFFLDKHIISIVDISPDAIPKRFSHHSRWAYTSHVYINTIGLWHRLFTHSHLAFPDAPHLLLSILNHQKIISKNQRNKIQSPGPGCSCNS